MDLQDLMKSGRDGEEGPKSDKMKAKMQVIDELRQMAEGMMGDKFEEGMKSVQVSSPTEEGLEEGLEKAGDILEEGGPEEMMAQKGDHSYSPEGEYEEDEMMSPEDIDAKIAELMEMKAQMEG